MFWVQSDTFVFCYIRTLLASSGSTLGHGSTTRTHAFRRPGPPKSGPPEALAHTHKIYLFAIRRVCSAGAHPVASPPSPASHRLASASLAVVNDPPPTPPAPPHTTSFSHCSSSGAGLVAPTQYAPPPSGESMDAMARAWLVMRTGEVTARVGRVDHCTTKDLVPWLPLAKEKLCPKPGAAHTFPFQPSPHESVMLSVHVAPSATANGELKVYGAPSLR